MSSVPELVRYIRFQLNQLRVRNEHHRFEDLARDFSRLRICQRILPATGPVGSGGDQGRDFETYRSFLQSTPIATSTFLGGDPSSRIVFGCSLQQGNIGTKIRSDIRTMCNSDYLPNCIVYFCEADIAVAERHRLQHWCNGEFGAELEIFDGQAIAENLVATDVFWIAQEYLEVPADMYPRESTEPDWYMQRKDRWLVDDRQPGNFADFIEIKQSLRRATFNESVKPDLRDWVHCMRRFLSIETAPNLRRNAIYEICVASLRGLNNLTAELPLLEEYFSDISSLESPTEMEDSVILASYCSTAFRCEHLEIDVVLLHRWSCQLHSKVVELLATDLSANTRCQLLVTAGRIGFLPYRDSANAELAIGDAFEYWESLFDIVDDAPLFPAESFSDSLVALTPLIGEDARFIGLAQRTDEILADRIGGHAAAEKCRDRAIAYYKLGNILLAIQQLHESKVRWFSAETMRGSLLSMLFLSDCYSSLGLFQAAKYYAAGVIFLAHKLDDIENKDFVLKAAIQFCDCCYSSGEWLNFMTTVWLAIAAQNAYQRDPQEIQEHGDMQRLLFHAAVSRIVAKRTLQNVSVYIEKMVEDWQLDEINRSAFNSLCSDETTWLYKVSEERLAAKAIEEMNCAPFSDLGSTRRITWDALGIRWIIESKADYSTTIAAEEFAATLQIVIADLAHHDLCLLPLTAKVEFHLEESIDSIEVEQVPDNAMASYRVAFPRILTADAEKVESLRAEVFAAAISILQGCTVLPDDDFLSLLHHAMKQGLPGKAFSVRPYSELFSELISEDNFNADCRSSSFPLADPIALEDKCHLELKWKDGPGPGYTREKAVEAINNRYKRAIKPICLSLPLWNKSGNFQEFVRALREEGYQDWHILLFLANHTVNYRVNMLAGVGAPMERFRELSMELMFREETKDDIPVPVTLFTKADLEPPKFTTIMAIAQTWGLVVKQQTPNFSAVKRYLDVRYNNNVDDIEHEDVFAEI